MGNWKTLSTKLLLVHPRLTVNEDEVELPNGHQTQYLKFTQNIEGAFVIAKNAAGLILVLKEYNYPPDEWLYHFPGGGFRSPELPEAAALRELSEEVDLTGMLTSLGWYYYDNRRSQDKQYYFLAEDLRDSPAESDIEEEFELAWLGEHEIDRLIKDGKVTNYAFLCGWSLYKAHMG